MLSTSNLPHGFWREALKIAVHVCNRSPHMTLKGGISEEVWYDKPASYDHLHIFGCNAFVLIRPELRSKLDAKSMNPQDAPHLAGNENEPVLFEPDDVGQQNDVPDGHRQPPIHAENRARNDVQQPINNEDVNVPPNVYPLPDNADHWVR